MASSARIDELRKKFDENPRRYFAPLANEFRKAGDLEQAVFICQEYLPQQPGHMSGHIVYGQALFELGRDEEAKAVFETALSLDPENLIALRHLGDIARQAGDLDVARFWYQRVLESDPRNEEISQVLMSLDATRGESGPPAVQTAPASEELVAEAVPESAPVEQATAAPITDQPTEPPPLPPGPAEPESYEPFEGFERSIDFDEPVMASAEGSDAPQAAEPVAPEPSIVDAAALEPIEAVAPDAHGGEEELLDLVDFSIGGAALDAGQPAGQAMEAAAIDTPSDLPLIELGDTDPFADHTPASGLGGAAGEASADSAADLDLDALSFGEAAHEEAAGDEVSNDVNAPAASFEPEMAADSASPATVFEPEPQGIVDAAATFEPAPAPEPAIELAADMELGLPPDETPAASPLEPEAMPSAEHDAAATPMPDRSLSREGTVVESPDAVDEVFATETMANLYVEQGHLADALEIYDRLLAHNPADERLEERARAIRERVYGKPRETVWEPEPVGVATAGATATAPQAGPTIRDFLRGVIARKPSAEHSNGAEPAAADEAPARAPTPGATVTGSIDALFANTAPSDDDRSAASALAQAFGEWPEPTPISGIPAHQASSELSLDHVFKANAPVPRRDDADAFSFDQFFSDELGESTGAGDSTSERAPSEGSDDIAQFNAWLNGLKKT